MYVSPRTSVECNAYLLGFLLIKDFTCLVQGLLVILDVLSVNNEKCMIVIDVEEWCKKLI